MGSKTLCLSFFEFFFFKLFLILFFVLVFLVFFSFFFLLSFFNIFLVILPIFFITEASAGENFISADTVENENQVVPFNQLIEHSFNKNYKGYNELAKAHNVGFYLGKNASSLNSEYPLLNSFNLIHQVFLASKLNSSNTVVSTDAFTKYEVAYFSKNQLKKREVIALLNEFHAPIVYLDFKNN
jgi:hypothetical protein